MKHWEKTDGNLLIPPRTLVWCKGIKQIGEGKEWKGVHRFTASVDYKLVALELLQVPDPGYRGEEIVISASRISTLIYPENLALIKPLL